MRKNKSERTEGIITILAAFFVLFSAMLDTRLSAVIAIGTLIGIGIMKINRGKLK